MPYIPDSVFKSGVWGNLKGSEAKVYTTLCQHYNKKKRSAFPSIVRISKISGCSERAVKYAIRSLYDRGLIIIRKRVTEYGDSDSNVYLLPDFLLYEYETLSKSPQKNFKELMEIMNMIIEGVGGSAKNAPRSAKITSAGAKKNTEVGQKLHPNYIINYINIINSFNKTSPEKKKESLYNRLEKFEEKPEIDPKEWKNIEEKFLHPLKEKLKR
ncbi:MAG: helix-turn-helix domain-containing protein [Candidatus Omnitrophica bacterium]|nr:helix-turn-helix domain-containing protein [Candidatus Omnitrophota bacterium]